MLISSLLTAKKTNAAIMMAIDEYSGFVRLCTVKKPPILYAGVQTIMFNISGYMTNESANLMYVTTERQKASISEGNSFFRPLSSVTSFAFENATTAITMLIMHSRTETPQLIGALYVLCPKENRAIMAVMPQPALHTSILLIA